jgi:regulator of nonsense transcripts 2
MMAESVDSRKFERRAVFDIPLPMKRSARETAEYTAPPQPSGNTMAFSLMTKKGNKQQVFDTPLLSLPL